MVKIDTGLSDQTIDKINKVLAECTAVQKAIIYGSRAKGNFKPYSDIDLSLVGPDLTSTVLHKIENNLDDLLLPYKLDLSIFHHIKNPDLIDHINRIGVDFYSKI